MLYSVHQFRAAMWFLYELRLQTKTLNVAGLHGLWSEYIHAKYRSVYHFIISYVLTTAYVHKSWSPEQENDFFGKVRAFSKDVILSSAEVFETKSTHFYIH